MRFRSAAAALAAGLPAAWAVSARAQEACPAGGCPPTKLTVAGVFADAAPEVQIVFAGLALATLASLAAWALGAAGRGGARGLGFLSGVRRAAPLFGATAATFTLMASFIGLSNVTPVPPLTVVAPGLAEATLGLLLGFLAAAVAAVGERHLEGRLRRAAA